MKNSIIERTSLWPQVLASACLAMSCLSAAAQGQEMPFTALTTQQATNADDPATTAVGLPTIYSSDNNNAPSTGNRFLSQQASPATLPAQQGTQGSQGGRGSTGAAEPLMPRPPGAFEVFVHRTTGERLGIFGASLFTDASRVYTPPERTQVNQDYPIGSGDQLQIRGWGMLNLEVTATVDRSGSIFIPRVGAVKVSGVKYRDLQAHLKNAVGRVYTNFDLSVTVSQVRSVQVYVVGHAARPGTYTLSAMSTLLNALFASGGPDAAGSMRRIEVRRGGTVVTTFDLYDMLVKGDKTRDVALQDGDVIHIPASGPLVAIGGNVKQPGIYELRGESVLADVLTWSGGFASAAEAKRVLIEKASENRFRTVVELESGQDVTDPRLGAIALKPADVLRVFAPGAVPVQARIENEYVRVSGEVAQSGVYALRKGETLRALLSRLGGVSDDSYVFGTELKRDSVRISQQQKLNEIADRFEKDIETGATQRLGASSEGDNIALINAALQRQRSQADRMRSVKAEGRIVLELNDGDAELKNLPDLALENGDTIYVPRRPNTVTVVGAVFQQNTFIYRPRRSLSDYVKLAGGVSVTAEESEIYVIRADGSAQSGQTSGWFSGVGDAKINPGDTIVVPEKIIRTSWTQSLKEWTSIFYQFGLGAAGLKVLKD